MKRNPLLRTTLSVLVCFFIAGFVAHVSVVAQASSTEGALLVLDTKGQPTNPCPLKHTAVKAEITGFLARVTVTQQFENPFTDKIEAVYTFPLPPAAAVDDMTIVVGDRTVNGKIMRREDAQATYDAARAKGQVAALLHQQRPNIFTQSVANILPGQQISVTISYVETLKYDEGSYEWSFPMVVGPRYIPGPDTAASEPKPTNPDPAAEPDPAERAARVPDAALINPPVSQDGRPGHDISIEVALDAGVPLIGFHSQTHEIEALQPGFGRAVVRLKDQATIPNRDFILRYDVAGNRIEDGLLTHRDDKGGFFTFILQPPQRITAADTMPKELVFVLDTSGSMEGFPLNKAKETMMLALDGLYPQDTFNVITFAGDTRILFSQPVPATPENLARAKKLLAHTKSEGGTEMMKAIRAALAPSDAQDHVRITCFMTDGQVGNDMEIISEVQKHPHSRVFAMGFGSAPNRFLLDKITEYGRGEVEYVAEGGDTSKVAKNFHDRIRNPLLTDVSIDWGGLPVTDVYPKTLPDLFSAKPVIISGRYTAGGKGIVRLKGMMSGRESVREIPVELPDREAHHDVLATLWARRKVDDLLGQDMSGAQAGTMRESLKTEITTLGLTYRMMTQFTSFVAVEDAVITDGGEPRRVDVAVAAPAGSGCPQGGICSTVMVTASADYSVSVTSTTQQTIQALPIQSRSMQSFMILSPGSVSPGPAQPVSSTPINIAVNGQRTSANQFSVDGVSGNFGIAPGGVSPGTSASGGTPPLTATGGTAALAPIRAVSEVTLVTHSLAAEYGRNSGSVVSVVTKAGTSQFHGSGSYSFNHEALNANDWFANSRGLAKPRHRVGDFGGTIGGPIKRDRWFFFAAYEGLRLRQPVVALSDVPSLTARSVAALNTRALLNLYPLPNRPERADGFAEFAASFANTGRSDAGRLRVDGHLSNNLTLSAFYSVAQSSANERGAGGFSLNTLNQISNRSQSFTGVAQYTVSPRIVAEARANYSWFTSRSSYLLDTFGGAILPATAVTDNNTLFSADLNGRSAMLLSGKSVSSTQRQVNTLGSVTMISGNHSIKMGTDYRLLLPVIGVPAREQSTLFDGVAQAVTGQAARINLLSRTTPTRPRFHNFSAFGQDEWRPASNVTITYGMRWELSPAPIAGGDRLWPTTYGNFAPRLGLAYDPHKNGELMVRAGFGILYDTSNAAAGDAFTDSYPFLNGQSQFNVPYSVPAAAPLNSNVPVTVPRSVFDPHLKLPYAMEWNVSVQRTIGSASSIQAAYVGRSGRRLLLTRTLLNQDPGFSFIRQTDNGSSSQYQSLQVHFERRFSQRLGAMVSYTFGKSQDNAGADTAARALFRSSDSQLERGPSDFDVRHTLSGIVSYQLPTWVATGIGNTLTRHWTLESTLNVRSAGPVNVVYAVPTSYGWLYLRPDIIPGMPLYLKGATVAGGRQINAAAFVVPQDLRQGTLGRNALRGFPLAELNLGLQRTFSFTESARLTVGAEASNVFNHPNFAAPTGNDASLGTRFATSAALHPNPTFGQSYTNAARSPWGIAGSTFGSNYYPGGPRSLRLFARFEF